MNNDIERVLISAEELEAHVAEIGRKITADFKDKDPIFVGVLKGCFIFMADLMRHVDIKCSMDFMAVSLQRHKLYGRREDQQGPESGH